MCTAGIAVGALVVLAALYWGGRRLKAEREYLERLEDWRAALADQRRRKWNRCA